MSAAAEQAEPEKARERPWLDWLVIAAGLAISLGVAWLVTGQLMVVLAFAIGIAVIGAAILLAGRRRPEVTVQEFAAPDWSVTVAAIDRPDMAIAISDRAGRLVCANPCFEAWFGVQSAPPELPADDASRERLAKAARSAWRDGQGRADLIEGTASESRRFSGFARRTGRGDDYLIWQFSPIERFDPVKIVGDAIEGKLGRALADAGIAAAVVDPAGKIIAASAGFARNAAGDATVPVRGEDFVAYLHQGEDDRISWARDGRRGAPLTLYHVPVADPDLPDEPDPETTPLLMLALEASLGIGSGKAEVRSAVPHLDALLGQLPLGLAMADRDGRLLFANAAFMRAAGREGEKPPTYPTDLVTRDDKGALSDAIHRFGRGPAASGDITVRLAPQPDEPVALSLAGVRGLGEAAVLLGLTDSTEETRLKRQVAQATKMQAVGQLAGGVAHDFNNVLTAIIGTCDLMLMRHTPGDSDYDDIQQIRANSNRAASLTRQLLAFSRQQTLRPEVLQLPDVVSDVSQMLKRLIGEKIQLVVQHDRDLGPVRADPTQLEQVIVNLAVNARDAMLANPKRSREPGGDRLLLVTRRITAAQVLAMRSEIMPAGDYTALVVEDTGGGIAPEHLGKIFEPFFTTKEPGKGGSMGGTGLGLSTVYGIVKQSGGFIFADSELGKGTRFTVYLPVHHVEAAGAGAGGGGEQRAIAAPKPAEPPREWSGGGRVLLVEDEDPVRLVAERALVRQGYEVTTACDGEEGLEIVRGGGTFDIVISDVVMPAMDGPAMVREIRKIAPALPIVFMSGYAEEQLRREIDIENMHFMPKPFSVQQISEKVGAVLAGAGRVH